MSSAAQLPSGSPDPGAEDDLPTPGGRITGWHRTVVGAAAVVLALAVAGHAAVTFFHIAPHNAVRTEHGAAIRGYLNPEFRQAWNLFGPDLPRTDTRVHARASVRLADGAVQTTEWTDLTATDIDELRGSLVPSRARHQLRKGWNDVRRWTDSAGQVHGRQGEDTRRLVTRIALDRMALPDGASVREIQFRSVTTPIAPPSWEDQPPSEPSSQEYPWWPVSDDDLPAGGDHS